MENEVKYYKILKKIQNTNKRNVSIIELENKKYILKSITNYDKDSINMLKNETNILYKLKDTDICPKIYSYRFDDKNNFLITELIKGKTINKLNLQNPKQKVLLILKITNVIKKIHKLNIVHCDLKPDNIILDLEGKIKIIDYGISVNEYKNYFKGYGSIKYCSKKQLTNQEIDKTVDIYSLGIIFYEMILGKMPFNGTKKEIIAKKRNNKYEKTENPLLNLIFSKIFDDNNLRKYNTIEELEKDLELFLK